MATDWYRDAIVYELHVRAFCDADGDGIGDFKGLTGKLDYIRDLGVTAIWLLPFYPSPLRDDGYDIADYFEVHPAYGNRDDFRRFVEESHRRGLRVITELVLNHTSDQHPWFDRARRAPPGSEERDFYVWSDTPDRYAAARIIFQDFESSNWSWDPVAKAYYWHRFYSHQPDLNFHSEKVREAMFEVVDHWLDTGVDGLRLDAVPYLFEEEGTNCENLPATHDLLKMLRRHVDERYPEVMLLSEANQWPEDAVRYFGDGDECHMAFHFPLMPRLFMALGMEDRFPVEDILEQTPSLPDGCQWALFLRNHDELTLEMVTEEERDFMLRSYATDPQARINLGIRRRLAPLLGNSRREIELLQTLLLSLPGTPFLYYGDEIGMGDNIWLGDRDAVRTPMQWNSDRNAGFSRANPQGLYLPLNIDPGYHYETVNVEAQEGNPDSLLWWTRRILALRRRHPVFGLGSMEMLAPDNPRVLAFVRRSEEEAVLVVANLSRFTQPVELELPGDRGRLPVEMFGRKEFPAIGTRPWFLSLSPHACHWFALASPDTDGSMPVSGAPTCLQIPGEPLRWFDVAGEQDDLAPLLAAELPSRRWFRSKARDIQDVRIEDVVPVIPVEEGNDFAVAIVIARVDYQEGEGESYFVPLAVREENAALALLNGEGSAILAHLDRGGFGERAIIYDAVHEPAFGRLLLDLAARGRTVEGRDGRIVGEFTAAGRDLLGENDTLPVRVPRVEQTNSSLVYGDRLVLKLLRRLEEGVSPDYELGLHLSRDTGFEFCPAVAGALTYHPKKGGPRSLGIFAGHVDHRSDAWEYTLAELTAYHERCAAGAGAACEVGPYRDSAELLGRRTAGMHVALAEVVRDPAFAPEPFGRLAVRSLYQSLRNSVRRSFELLRRHRERLPEACRDAGRQVIEGEERVMDLLARLRDRPLGGLRIRCHGDYHLGQVLWTGRDFVIIDFEGEPARPLGERRIKRSPLRDAAGMLRSFAYAAACSVRDATARGGISGSEEAQARHRGHAERWRKEVSSAFYQSWLGKIREVRPELLPDDEDDRELLLRAWLFEKALYEVRYELNHRPDWVEIPLGGILDLLEKQ